MEFAGIKPGLRAESVRKVTKRMCVAPSAWTSEQSQGSRGKRKAARGSSEGYVLSSPAMIQVMEQTCLKEAHKHLPPGYTTVGYHVDVRHLAPTPLGERIRVTSELKEVDGNKLTFAVEAYYGDTKIGAGFHRRAIVPVRRPAD